MIRNAALRRSRSASYSLCGLVKLWKAARRTGPTTLASPGREPGVQPRHRGGGRRGKPVKTPKAELAAPRHPDLVNCCLSASARQPIGGDRSDVYAHLAGVAYICVIVDVLPEDRRMAGRVEHAHHHGPRRAGDARWSRGNTLPGLTCHSDAGPQFASIRYAERRATIGALPSTGSARCRFDYALAETVEGHNKDELI